MSATSAPPARTHFDVIVIGAGVAGLQCAATLREEYGITSVVVLEAQDYVGGRVKVDSTFCPGTRVCLGAEIVHGDTNVITALASRNSWTINPTFTWAQGDGGPSKEESPSGGAGYYYVGALKKLFRFNEVPEEMNHMNRVLWDMTSLQDMDVDKYRDPTLRQHLVSCGVAEPYLDMACAGFANTAAGSIDNIPLAEAVFQARMWEADGDLDMHLEATTAIIPEHLSKGLHIELNAVVAHVAVVDAASGTPSSSVAVTLADGRVFTADGCVVTVPPPILRDGDISFSPPLALSRMQALRNIHFANGVKVHLKFRERVWPADCEGMICSQTYSPELWFQTCPQSDGSVLHMATCFAMDARADAMAATPPETSIALALSQICDMFGPDAAKHFISGRRMVWAEQKHIRGGYTCATARERSGDRIAIAEPHFDRVFFGGEACASAHGESPQTLVGSMQTGQRTARQAARLIVATRPDFRPVSKL